MTWPWSDRLPVQRGRKDGVRGDPITLTLGAARLDLSRSRGRGCVAGCYSAAAATTNPPREMRRTSSEATRQASPLVMNASR